jgi:cellulose synthase/poly-beta-1,6-N-acetylglucosamine synthase-like glycosyltransferase
MMDVVRKAGNKIEYLDDAFIYDEKVQKAEVFLIQRRRWLSAQFHYFRQDFFDSLKCLILNGNIDYFDKAIQFIQPPRIMLISLLPVFGGIFVFLNYSLGINQLYSIFWIVVNALCALTFLFSIPTEFYNLKTLGALKSLPKGIILMFGSLSKIKGANKEFLHTKHDGNNADSV